MSTPMMRPFSRRGLLAGGASLAALAVAGCAGPSVGGPVGEQQQPDETDWASIEPATDIAFWTNHPGNSMELEKAMAASFKEKTGITVNLVTAGKNYEEVSQKFQTAQTGGQAGDLVVISDVTWFNYFLNSSIIALDGLWEHLKFDIPDYRDALIADYLYKDAHYGVPYARSTPLFYYNKDAFAAAGVPDEVPALWSDFAEIAPTIASKTGKPAFAFPREDSYPGWTLGNLLWGYGGGWSKEWDFSIVDGDANVEALTFAQDATKAKWAQVASSDQSEVFSSGAVAATLQSTGSLKGILSSAKFEVGVGFLPGGPVDSDKVCPTGGAGIGIAAKSPKEKQLAAAMFIQHATDPQNSATFSAGTGYMPCRKSADMSKATAENPLLQVAVDQLDKTRSQDFGRVALPGGDLNIARMCQQLLTSEIDVKTRLTELRGQLEGIYNTDLKPKLG